MPSPFDLSHTDSYRYWRDALLHAVCSIISNRVVQIVRLSAPTGDELRHLRSAIAVHGFALYRTDSTPGEGELKCFARALGLERSDAGFAGAGEVRHLRAEGPRRQSGRQYIPYTNRALNWHTDGYYNDAGRAVRAFVMHCVSPAASGGENQFLDPRRVYVALRDENPDWIRALTASRALGIPPNVIDGHTVRPARYGPVFYAAKSKSSGLGMRYTIRERHVEWAPGREMAEARCRLQRLLEDDELGATRWRFSAGEGIVCANVLHARTAFKDAPNQSRHVLRARYLDAIAL